MSKPDAEPFVSKELLARLTQLFPDRCPDLNDSDREVWAAAGSQRVIRWLRAQFQRQQQDMKVT